MYDTELDGQPASFHGDPFLDDGLLIVGSDVAAENDGYLYAFDQKSGEVRWKHRFARGVPVDVLGRDGNVFVVTMGGEALCVAQKSGEIVWRNDDAEAAVAHIGAASLLFGDTFVFTAQTDVCAIDTKTGKLSWRQSLETRLNTSIVEHSGRLFVGDESGILYRLSPKDGSVETTTDTGGMPYGSLMAIADGIIVLWRNAVPEGDDVESAPHTIACLDPSLEDILWQKDNEYEWSTYRPLLGESTVVVGDKTGLLLELSTKDGAELWSTTIDGMPRGLSSVGDGIVIGTFDGTVYSVRR